MQENDFIRKILTLFWPGKRQMQRRNGNWHYPVHCPTLCAVARCCEVLGLAWNVHITTAGVDPGRQYVQKEGATGCRRHTVSKCLRSSAAEIVGHPNCPGLNRQSRNPSPILRPASATSGEGEEKKSLWFNVSYCRIWRRGNIYVVQRFVLLTLTWARVHLLERYYPKIFAETNQHESWSERSCQSNTIKIKNTQEIKRTLLKWTKQDKTWKFSRKSSFSSYVQHTHRKTIQFPCVRCSEAGGRKRARDWLSVSWVSLLLQISYTATKGT